MKQVDRQRVMGCWLGKAVGGTLGQTFEGLEGPLEAEFYVPVPTEMVPNDDLDLQVLYACVMDLMDSPAVDRHVLAESWRNHVEFPWNEYGVGMRNQAEGIEPPHSGSFDNWFTCGEGAAIRSELWACLAAGDADLAGAYAYEDACFDHAGDGIDAAVFLARIQALAFVESDPKTLIDGALAGLPPESGITRVVRDTLSWLDEGLAWRAVRELIVARYGNSDFTDVRINTGFIILGWLAGTSFGERILITNNCGGDCDSSTASIGALLGILDPDSIEERWLAPIGRDLVLNPEITGIEAPPTLDAFTDLVLDLRERLDGRAPEAVSGPFDPQEHRIEVGLGWMNTSNGKWDVRDQTELPPAGSAVPEVDLTTTTLPGTWVRMPAADFADRILVLRYRFDARGRTDVRLMFNSTEHYRIWFDGEYLHGAQGSQYQFPAPHMAPLGQFIDFRPGSGVHEITIAVKRPPAHREIAEWVIGAVELPGHMWIENSFRPDAVGR
ncbi:ADP-ribosylglycohydrolase family protein [Occultella gossypii]|uniref:ADP-ribosylglycohydrolase family protein n=1 Tax=Occultella gossypii TaxID=2800820 RepID=A0ABS7SF31_9MICO|nr:ADP-ribosylglycohydrolase family protein [Occultella gossypii]MBZ2198962.1 ADP-ribosylglycohydrolase family protein [Occultella gossypii]